MRQRYFPGDGCPAESETKGMTIQYTLSAFSGKECRREGLKKSFLPLVTDTKAEVPALRNRSDQIFPGSIQI